MTEQIDNNGNAAGVEKAQDGTPEAVKWAVMRHKYIRAFVGIAMMAGVMIYLAHFTTWLLTIHDNVLAGWINPLTLAGPAGSMAGLTIILTQTRIWWGTTLLCMAGLLVAVQMVAGTVGAALLLSDWQAVAPRSVLVQLLPLLGGIAVAAPTSVAVIFLSPVQKESGAEFPPHTA